MFPLKKFACKGLTCLIPDIANNVKPDHNRDSLTDVYVPFPLYCPILRAHLCKKEKMDNFMCLLEFEFTKRLKVHSQAIPAKIGN